MARRRALLSLCAIWIVLASGARPAAAGVTARRSHRVASGDSLWKIARAYRCTVEDLRRANRLAGNSIQPGQRLRIPPCDGEAREADAASDIHEVIAPELDASARKERRTVAVAVPLRGQSFGRPQNGYLVSGRQMPRDPAAYHLRRPERAWGADHTVRVIRRAIHQVRKRYPRVHPLAIGDLSARHGGRISMHGSHQSGRDADIGFYFRRPPRGYPRSFAVASAANLDFPATWALISALCRTGEQALGVERIYMTYSTQAMFYRLARRHGVARARLDRWFQYPHGRRANHGIIRHEPGHEEHIHVRFRCAPADAECE